LKYLDPDLVALARKLAEARYVEGKHQLFSALKVRGGQVYMGVNVEGGQGRVSLCAEAVAIGAAVTAGEANIESIVTVTESGDVVAPCGMCRELISDHSPRARVLLEVRGVVVAKSIDDLLPAKYQRLDYPNKRRAEEKAKAVVAAAKAAAKAPKTAKFDAPKLSSVPVDENPPARKWREMLRFWVLLSVLLYGVCAVGLSRLKDVAPWFDITLKEVFGWPGIALVSVWGLGFVAWSLRRSRPAESYEG
jgi:cytidine deaminase